MCRRDVPRRAGFDARLHSRERPDSPGPKSLPDSSIPDVELKQMGEPQYPLFYLNYAPDPAAAPWLDAIGRMVKFLKGSEYAIRRPRDLSSAVSESVDRMAKWRETRAVAPSGSK